MTSTVRGSCHHDCPDTCVWEVTVDDGRAVRLRGVDDHPTTAGQLCPKVNRFLDRVYHPDRVLTPLRRTGPKGAGEFEPISWDEALAEIADRWGSLVESDGPESILQFSFAGTQGVVQMGTQIDLLFDRIGASDIRRHLCGVTSYVGAADVLGTALSIDPEDLRHARTIVLWGTNTLLTNRHLWPTIEAARAAGGTIVCVDPVRTVTAERSDVHLQLSPGTDETLVAAVIAVLVRDGLTDEAFLAEHTDGWDELRASVAGLDLDEAAATTGIAVERIEWLAHLMATNRPAAVRALVGPEHRRNGRAIQRAVTMLPAVVGAWRDVGGGLARSTQAWFEVALGTDEQPRPLRRKFNMAHLGAALLGELDAGPLDPPIRSLFVHNSNPAVICPDQDRVVRGLEREDLFTVVHEQFVTDTARYADIVLPATTQIEQLDLGIAWGHLYLSLNQPAIEPLGEAVSNTEVARRLAAALGIDEPLLRRSDEQVIRDLLDRDHPLLGDITYESLAERGWQRLAVEPGTRPVLDHPTTDGRPIRLGPIEPTSPRQPDPAHPFLLMSRKHHPAFLNVNYAPFPAHHPKSGGPTAHVHPDDAAEHGLVDGATVAVANRRGALQMPVALSTEVPQGVVAVPFGWTNDAFGSDRSVNVLTSPETADDDQGSAFFLDTWVSVTAV